MNSSTKNQVLTTLAALLDEETSKILSANEKDIKLCDPNNKTLYDRLKVDRKKINGMIQSLKTVAKNPDPEGKVIYEYNHPSGIEIQNKKVPFGNILIIYESRPDVTVEATSIAFKSGNKIYLKGGKESKFTNLALVNLWHEALNKHKISKDYINYLDLDRAKTAKIIKQNTYNINLIIPRGGEGLLKFIRENSNVPILESGRGNNFLYIHKSADLKIALDIAINAKLQRISVCNAIDKILIDTELKNKPKFVSDLKNSLKTKNTKIYEAKDYKDNDSIWYEEFLDYKVLIDENIKSHNQAIEKINKYSGGHSAAIVTKDTEVANEFMNKVDCAAVYHNASTRFTDGGEFGKGAEIGISTSKLHSRGPLGVEDLLTNKWFIEGNGQIRN